MPRGVPGPVVFKTKRKAPSTAFKKRVQAWAWATQGLPEQIHWGSQAKRSSRGSMGSHEDGVAGFVPQAVLGHAYLGCCLAGQAYPCLHVRHPGWYYRGGAPGRDGARASARREYQVRRDIPRASQGLVASNDWPMSSMRGRPCLRQVHCPVAVLPVARTASNGGPPGVPGSIACSSLLGHMPQWRSPQSLHLGASISVVSARLEGVMCPLPRFCFSFKGAFHRLDLFGAAAFVENDPEIGLAGR